MEKNIVEYGRITMMVEINGRVCAVCLPQERMRMLLKMAEGLSDDGKVPIHELPESVQIVPISEIEDDENDTRH